MNVEDVNKGMQVRATGYESHGDEVRIYRRPDAPIMVVREVIVVCAWFADGIMHQASFAASDLEAVK